MDPKTPSNLDPNLKEVYERVMGASPSVPPVQPEPQSSPPAPSPATTFVAPTTEKKSKISPLILVLGLIVFFAIYTLFWVRFFNIPLPFLPQ